MPSFLDYARLSLRDAFDFAIMIEEDAQLRYEQLSRLIGDDPGGVGDVFRAMVVNEGKHRKGLVARREALFGDEPPRIAISVLDASVERPEVLDEELPRTARAALEVTLAAEQCAHAFYSDVLARVLDPEVQTFFEDLRGEEAEHAALIERQISRLVVSAAGDAPALPPAVLAPPPAPPGEYPDRASVEAVLPRFDAATQAVARSVIVDGLALGTVAAALGVSRRTVARKLAGFLEGARAYVAMAFAAAALAGCSGGGVPDVDGAARAGVQPQRGALSRDSTAAGERPVDGARADEAGGERADQHASGAERRAVEAAAAAAAAVDLEFSEGLNEPPQQQVVPAKPHWTPPATATATAPTADAAAAPTADAAAAPAADATPEAAIEDVWPDKTSEAGGERVVIRGQNLQPAQILFGMVPATIVEVARDHIVVIAPAAKEGEVKIVVTNRDGSYAIAADAFRYYR
jgi:rubrerythrin